MGRAVRLSRMLVKTYLFLQHVTHACRRRGVEALGPKLQARCTAAATACLVRYRPDRLDIFEPRCWSTQYAHGEGDLKGNTCRMTLQQMWSSARNKRHQRNFRKLARSHP